MSSGKFYRFALILFISIFSMSASLASAESPQVSERFVNCADLLMTHIRAHAEDDSTYLPVEQLTTFLHGREEALILLKIPVDQIASPIGRVLDFSFASSKVQLVSDLHLLVGPNIFIVARGPSLELGEFANHLNSKHDSKLSFQLLDSHVTESTEIDFSFRPRMNRLNLNQQDPKTALKKEFDTFEVTPQVGFWALESNINEAIYFVSAKSFESISKSPAFSDIANFKQIGEKDSKLLGKILKTNLGLIKSSNPIAIRLQDYYILNSAASEALVELKGSRAPSLTPSSVVVEENLVKHLLQCLPGHCKLDPAFEAQLPADEPAVQEPALPEPISPQPAPIDQRFTFRRPQPKLAKTEVVKEKFPNEEVTNEEISTQTPTEQPALKITSTKRFSAETLHQLDVLDQNIAKLESNPSAFGLELAKSELTRFKHRLVTHYREKIKPQLELYALAHDEFESAKRTSNQAAIKQLNLDILSLGSEIEAAYKEFIGLLRQDSEKMQEFVLEIAPDKGQPSDGEDVKELSQMYMELVRLKGGKAEIIKQSSNDHGFRFVAIKVKGKGLVDLLKFEQGSHRIIKQQSKITVSRLLNVKLTGDIKVAQDEQIEISHENSPHVRVYRFQDKNQIEDILAGPRLLKQLEQKATEQALRNLGKLIAQ